MENTKNKKQCVIHDVMARLLYVLWNLTVGLIIALEIISLIWIPYWLFTGKWILDPTIKWILKVDERINLP